MLGSGLRAVARAATASGGYAATVGGVVERWRWPAGRPERHQAARQIPRRLRRWHEGPRRWAKSPAERRPGGSLGSDARTTWSGASPFLLRPPRRGPSGNGVGRRRRASASGASLSLSCFSTKNE
uniref:Uncharacterized protein n=1 Tax=Oryza sativa subsp. japonica TaxID=39947 RepID=Q69XY4_ORYSJ|nr:hypothetical protein [Oryza sativa Japonica Group]